jgi:RNA 2',3'-cyclic 3'-phosphodiesterase
VVPGIAGGPWRALALTTTGCLHSTDHFRLFVALPAPEQVKNAIQALQDQLRRALPAKVARWTRPEQFHLTVRFLGSIAGERMTELVEAMQQACEAFAPLKLEAGGLGFFPDTRFPRVLWAAVKDRSEQLESLWRAVQSATQPFTAEAAESRFVGHITLARLNRLKASEAEALTRAVDHLQSKALGEWRAPELQLMRSELSPQGARHTVVAALTLAGNRA